MAKTKFQVVLDNVDLSAAQIKAIQKEINAVVAKSLLTSKKPASAKTAAAASAGPVLAYKIPPDWIGLWIKNLKSIDLLKSKINVGLKVLTPTSLIGK